PAYMEQGKNTETYSIFSFYLYSFLYPLSVKYIFFCLFVENVYPFRVKIEPDFLSCTGVVLRSESDRMRFALCVKIENYFGAEHLTVSNNLLNSLGIFLDSPLFCLLIFIDILRPNSQNDRFIHNFQLRHLSLITFQVYFLFLIFPAQPDDYFSIFFPD